VRPPPPGVDPIDTLTRPNPDTATAFLARGDLGALLDALRDDGRQVIGPTVVDGTIMLDRIEGVEDLPIGWHDEHEPGRYRLRQTGSDRVFAHNLGPSGPKRWTYPSFVPIERSHRTPDGTTAFAPVTPDAPPLALIGIRACELAALGIHDMVLRDRTSIDADYAARRASLLIVAVNCTTRSATCFCTSMGTGPEVTTGHDLALTEIDGGFVVEAGSPAGVRLLAALPATAMRVDQAVEAATAIARTRAEIGDPVKVAGLHERLLAKLDSPRWAEIAERCLSCANCTLVCPTCFCTSIERTTDLAGTEAVSNRVWDSCFTVGFGVVAGGENFRSRPRDRYRQWLVHKFASWWDQFGSAGCVGCGRCITFCPAAIDIRAELEAIAPASPPPPPQPVAARTPEARQLYVPATITERHAETPDTVSLTLHGLDEGHQGGTPGQFVMVNLPGFPPAAISVSRYLPPDGLVLTIRAAGPATTAITALPVGATVGIRGPVGSGWPTDVADGRDVVVITGGTGLAPLRPLLDHLRANRERFGDVRLYYGARTAGDMLFADELSAWARDGRLEVICRWLDAAGFVDAGAAGGASRSTVSSIHQASWSGDNAIAYVCGPERMMQAVSVALAGRGVTSDRTFVTLERHMECGVGLCGHCQLGRYFVCADGPVFRLDALGPEFGREGM
jgi:NAD(P)H-flavin reductase/formate hydrogenlyase subunit 6/NADH:ubiquinone oxidoreductase subunit I